MPARAATTRRPASVPFRPPSADAAKPAWDAIPNPTSTEFVAIGECERDERVNTRPVDTAWVDKKAEDFHPEALGKPVVSRRADGTVILIDGQNRHALVLKTGWEGWAGDGQWECEIHEGLSLIEEAGLFSLLAGHRSFTAMAKFLARQTQEDEVVLAVTKIVEQCGYRIGTKVAGDTINAVKTLEKIYTKDAARHPGEPPSALTALDATLRTMVKAWQHTPGCTDQAIIDGIGMLYLKYGTDFIDQDLMITVLAAYPGGPKQLKTNGSGAKNIIKGSVGKGVAFSIGQDYDDEQTKYSKKLRFAAPR